MLKKKERSVPIGKRSDHQEYPRIGFQQALDFALILNICQAASAKIEIKGNKYVRLRKYEKKMGCILCNSHSTDL